MDGLDWTVEGDWTRHKVRRWKPYGIAAGIFLGGAGAGLVALHALPEATHAFHVLTAVLGMAAGDRLGTLLANVHVRLQEAALAKLDAAKPLDAMLGVTTRTIQRVLADNGLPTEDCTVLVLWEGGRTGYVMRELHIYGPDRGYVELDQVGPAHGAGGSPRLPLPSGVRLWGAQPMGAVTFTASLPLASAHQRLACAAWVRSATAPPRTGQAQPHA